jgi:hypothetical protein
LNIVHNHTQLLSGVAIKGDKNDAEQKKGTLDSQMQRLQIAGKQGDEDAMLLEEAIQLAAAEKKETEKKEKENCTHGYNPSSRSQERFCRDYMSTPR